MTLQLDNIHVTVTDGPDQLTILAGVDLTVDAGELVAVTDASGSGKSTLIAVAGLLRRPEDGSVVIGGEDVTQAVPPATRHHPARPHRPRLPERQPAALAHCDPTTRARRSPRRQDHRRRP